MTREVAIRNLEMIRIAFVNPVTKEQRKLIDDTVDMAISALSENKGDLISRQAVLDEMDKRHAEGDCITKGFIKALPSVENKGEWIPVSERLPRLPKDKQEVKVIVSYENEDGEFVEKGVFNKRYGFNFPSVKAWQPLPEPYKAEGVSE